jgi:flavin prenyltransferase
MKIIVGISGASGPHYGIRLLEVLRTYEELQTHLVISDAAKLNIALETNRTVAEVEALADCVYEVNDLAAPIASGSFLVDAMVIAPCSVKTLSGLAHSFDTNLLIRAGDVMLKEKRKLIILFRESPVHVGHLRLMTALAEMGGTIMLPAPAFYHRPTTIAELIDHTIGKVLDQLGLAHQLFRRWEGKGKVKRKTRDVKRKGGSPS